MQPSTASYYPSSLEAIVITGAVLVACIAGAVIFLGWLDKKVPSLPDNTGNAFLISLMDCVFPLILLR